MIIKRTTIILLLAFLTAELSAQDTGSGLDFLNIGPSTRILSIGEATTATPTGSSAIYTNPALLAWEERSSADASYTLWIADVANQSATVNLPSDSYSLAFGVYNSRSSGFEARDTPGDAAGTFSIGYLSLAAAYAYKLGPVSVGVTGQFIREEVFQFRANGFALTAGAILNLMNDRVRLGTAFQNLGEMDDLNNESTQLPSNFRAGISADLIEFVTPEFNDLPILISLHFDYTHAINDLPTSDYADSDNGNDFFVLAMSAKFSDLFYLQSGYKFGPTERPFSVGAGIDIAPITVNYAFVPFSTGFGNVHSMGIQYYF